MSPLVAALDAGLAIGVIVPIGSLLIIIMTAIITSHLRRLQRDDMEATLKMEMIQRGMSADEIERVLAARMGQASRHGHGGYPQQRMQHQH